MVRKRADEPHWTRLPFPAVGVQPGQVVEICASPQRELRGPYQLEFSAFDVHSLVLEEMQVGQEVCGAAWGQSGIPIVALTRRNLCGPCVQLGNQVKLRLRNISPCTQHVETTLLAEFIPDELRGLGCSFHRHVVRGCDACRERARLRRKGPQHSYSNTLDVAERPDPRRWSAAVLDFPYVNDPHMLSDDDEGDDFTCLPQRRFGTHGPRLSPASNRLAALKLIEGRPQDLLPDQLHHLLGALLLEANRRNDLAGLPRIRFEVDRASLPPLPTPAAPILRETAGPELLMPKPGPCGVWHSPYVTCSVCGTPKSERSDPPPAPQLLNINPLPPGGIVRHCLNREIGKCGVCSLCVGKATLHVREEPPPAPPPPPDELPPAKGPEFDRQGFEVEPTRDAPPAPLRAVDTIPLTSDHPTATPTRAGLRLLEEQRHAALVAEFEAWESATDEYP